MAVRKILVVDDSPTERLFLMEILTKAGYSVIVAENGEDALEKVRADRPDLICMDVIMPGATNGFQVTRTLSKDEEFQGIPVIIITSKKQETDRVWGMRQGAKDYLVKPVSPEALLASIKSLSDQIS